MREGKREWERKEERESKKGGREREESTENKSYSQNVTKACSLYVLTFWRLKRRTEISTMTWRVVTNTDTFSSLSHSWKSLYVPLSTLI